MVFLLLNSSAASLVTSSVSFHRNCTAFYSNSFSALFFAKPSASFFTARVVIVTVCSTIPLVQCHFWSPVSNHQVSSLDVSSASSPWIPNSLPLLKMILTLPSAVSRIYWCLSYNYTFSKSTDSFLAWLASKSPVPLHSRNLQLFIFVALPF